jgi:hypothetical protein
VFKLVDRRTPQNIKTLDASIDAKIDRSSKLAAIIAKAMQYGLPCRVAYQNPEKKSTPTSNNNNNGPMSEFPLMWSWYDGMPRTYVGMDVIVDVTTITITDTGLR